MRLWTFKVGLPQFRNSPVNNCYPAIPRPVSLFSRPFSSAQNGLKSKPKIFLNPSGFKETEKGAKLTIE
jgi:hypothetical protein